MTTDKIELELTLAPFRNLIRSAKVLEGYIGFKKLRWFSGARDDFSWVYGVSEVEIEDFSRLYDQTRQEIKSIIERTENEKLKAKMTGEYKEFPALPCKQFTLDTNDTFWILKTFRPGKKIRNSIKFKRILDEIWRTCERMINYSENIAWLELEKTKENGG